jgi:hypothetical protein
MLSLAELTRLDADAANDRIRDALAFLTRHGQPSGEERKAWVIDQTVRILAGAQYPEVVRMAEIDNERDWDVGRR